jgi:succinate dehydrogenase hydrophobic anchor subunit
VVDFNTWSEVAFCPKYYQAISFCLYFTFELSCIHFYIAAFHVANSKIYVRTCYLHSQNKKLTLLLANLFLVLVYILWSLILLVT